MPEGDFQTPKKGSSGSEKVKIEDTKGTHATQLAMVQGATIVSSILAFGVVIAIAIDSKQEKNYAAAILPLLSAALAYFGGFNAGKKSNRD